MIRLNQNVKPLPVHAIPMALQVAEGVWHDFGSNELTVTSLTEGKHVSGSLHPTGMAVDLRIRHFPASRWDDVADALKRCLPGYDVRLERQPPAGLEDSSSWGPHIHVGYRA